MKLIVSVVVIGLMVAVSGIAMAQWWNPLESECSKSARLQSELMCNCEKRSRSTTCVHVKDKGESTSECETRIYADEFAWCVERRNR